LDPTVVVGGRVDAMGSNARLGKSHYLVAEADESDRSFLKLSPILSVVTNIDREHMDCYRDMQDVENTFIDFMDRVPFYGMVVVCNDDARVRSLIPKVQRRVMTYGERDDSDFRITGESQEKRQASGCLSLFRVSYRDRDLGEFRLNVPGAHNVLNATAAIAVGIGLDIPPDKIRGALESFRGVDRRFQLRGQVGGVAVIDDYGHHPTEIRATLAAARQCGYKRVHVVFQPHRYTRTQALMEEFAGAFRDADSLFLLDIYPASEAPIPGITAQALVEKIIVGGHAATYVNNFAEAAAAASSAAQPGDMVLTLGAGNVSQLGPQILDYIEHDRSQVAGRPSKTNV
jgi:UDP-N-acetylmuramate--alanine ligase